MHDMAVTKANACGGHFARHFELACPMVILIRLAALVFWACVLDVLGRSCCCCCEVGHLSKKRGHRTERTNSHGTLTSEGIIW